MWLKNKVLTPEEWLENKFTKDHSGGAILSLNDDKNDELYEKYVNWYNSYIRDKKLKEIGI